MVLCCDCEADMQFRQLLVKKRLPPSWPLPEVPNSKLSLLKISYIDSWLSNTSFLDLTACKASLRTKVIDMDLIASQRPSVEGGGLAGC